MLKQIKLKIFTVEIPPKQTQKTQYIYPQKVEKFLLLTVADAQLFPLFSPDISFEVSELVLLEQLEDIMLLEPVKDIIVLLEPLEDIIMLL